MPGPAHDYQWRIQTLSWGGGGGASPRSATDYNKQQPFCKTKLCYSTVKLHAQVKGIK